MSNYLNSLATDFPSGFSASQYNDDVIASTIVSILISVSVDVLACSPPHGRDPAINWHGKSQGPGLVTLAPDGCTSDVGFKCTEPVLNYQYPGLTSFSFPPGLDEIIVIDGLALWFFIGQFRFRRTRLI